MGALPPSSYVGYWQMRGPLRLAPFDWLRFLFQSTGTARDHSFYWRGYSALFEGSRPTSRRRSRDRIMHICFNHSLHHGSDRPHTVMPPLRRRLSHPLGLNLGTHNIREDCGFGLPQAIRAMPIGNYELMVLTEKKIPYEAYCYNNLGYDAVCSQAVGTTDGGGIKGGW